MSTGKYDFDVAFQKKILALFMRDSVFALRCRDLIKPEYFTEDAISALVRIFRDHVSKYGNVPDLRIVPQIVKDEILAKRVRKDMIPDITALVHEMFSADISNPKFVTDKVVDFAKHQEMERAIMESVGFLEKGKFSEIAERMRQALLVGEGDEGDGYDYYERIADRTKVREDIVAGRIVKNGITTGYSGIDCYLYHNGWGRKELSCIMGPAKSGKSLSLGDFCKNASLAGHKVLYVSLEVAKEIIAERIDAAISDTIMRDMPTYHASVEDAVRKAHLRAGTFEMRDFASGTFRPSQLRALLDRYRSKGITFDLVAVDYADIMAPEHRSDSLQENLRTIYIDLRAIAFDYNIAMLTATQTNRDGAKAATAKATDVGDDWNKARTVDILIGLNATDAEKRVGKARLYWALSRNTEDGFSIEIQQDRQKMQFIKKILGRV